MATTTSPRPPGHEAETPVQIPARGWWQVTRRAFKESSDDNVSILAGGVAFFAFLAIFPAIIAAITLYGLIGGRTLRADDESALDLMASSRPAVRPHSARADWALCSSSTRL